MDRRPASPPVRLDEPRRPEGLEGRGREHLDSACSVSLARSAIAPLLRCARVPLAASLSSRAVADYLAHVALSVPVEAIASLSRRTERSVSRDIGRIEGLRDTPAVDAALALLEAGLVRLQRSFPCAP
jgi:hypothetical protein